MNTNYSIDFKREELKEYKGKVVRLTACFSRFGYADQETNERGVPILVKDIKLDGEPFSDHAWILTNDELKGIEIDNFDLIEFDTRIGQYVSGMPYFTWGYKLDGISNIRVISKSRTTVKIEDIYQLTSSLNPTTRISYTEGRLNKLKRRFPNLSKDIASLMEAPKVYLLLDEIDSNGSIHFKYSLTPLAQLNQYKSGAIFDQSERNKVVVMNTGIIQLPQREYTTLSNFYFKNKYTKTDYRNPFKVPEEMQLQLVRNLISKHQKNDEVKNNEK